MTDNKYSTLLLLGGGLYGEGGDNCELLNLNWITDYRTIDDVSMEGIPVVWCVVFNAV